MTDALSAAVSAHRTSDRPATLLLEEDVSLAVAFREERGVSKSKLPAADLWAYAGEPMRLVVLSAERPGRELFRALSLAERIVSPGGALFLVGGDSQRVEATEAFLGVHPGWTRHPIGGAIELRKPAAKSAGPEAEPKPAPIPEPKGERVIALSVFGKGHYWQYLRAFVRAHAVLFPGYSLRVYHDDAIYQAAYGDALHGLEEMGFLKLVRMAKDGLSHGKCRSMLWRLAAAWDPEVEHVFSRDLDALPTWRERCAVEAFVSSGLDLHTIHDNPAHDGVMGGLCGARAEALRGLFPSFEAFVEAAGFSSAEWSEHGADQIFLNSKIAPKLKLFEHSVFVAFEDNGTTRRIRKPSPFSARFETGLPPVDDPRVPLDIREASNGLIPYMGVAGYPHEDATAFYDERGPKAILDGIREAEEFQWTR